MTKKLEICLILLLVLCAVSAVSARQAPNLPRRSNSSAVFNTRPQNFDRESLRTFCEDNNVPHDTWFTSPFDCREMVGCWDLEDGNGVTTDFYSCKNEDWWFVQTDWRGSRDGGVCFEPDDDDVCPFENIFWPPCPPASEREPVFHPSQQCDSYYFCVGGRPFLMQCGPGLHWNANRGFCDQPSRAGCESNWTPSPPQLPDCPVGEIMTLPHPADCELFIVCNNGNRIVSRCPHLHHFDIIRERCIIVTQNPVCLVYGRPR